MSLFRRGEIWWLYVVHNGRRIRRSTQTDNRKIAQRIHDEFRGELWKHKPRGSFYGALDAWSKDADEPDRYRVGKLKRIYKDRPLHEVTAESLEKALPETPGTYNRYVILIQAALHRAKITISIPRKKTPASRVRWLTADEWGRLDKALPDHLRPLARFAVATGLRQRNVTHLEWSQIDLGRRVAWVHADQAKARRAIGIPLSDAAMAVLRSQRGINERWVFPYRDKPIGKIKSAWGRALKRADIEDFTWHDLRHTWASWHIQNGTRLEVLKELGGWASMAMVMRYAHLSSEHLAAYANNAKPRHVSRHRKKKAA